MKEIRTLDSILLANSPNPVLLIGKDTSIIYVNPALEDLTGYSAHELMGRKAPYPWWLPMNNDEIMRNIAGTLSKGEKFERINCKQNGELFWVEITSRPIIIKGEFKYFLSSWVDITRHKQAEKVLQETEEFNASLLSNAPNPILVLAPDTSIRYVNPAVEELTGFCSRELVGVRSPYPFWPMSLRKRYHTQFLKDVGEGVHRAEIEFMKKNGESFWAAVASKPMLADGELKYFLLNWVDITRRKEAERELNNLNEDLRNLSAHLQSVREKERAQISREVHDEFGQALAALKMDACWISDNLEKGQEDLHKITASMLQLIEITLQKVKWLSVGLRPRLLDDIGLKEAIHWLAQEFQGLTGTICTVTVTTDNKKLNQDSSTAIFRILQEALTNVFRHARATRVKIDLKQTAADIILRISDNGRGITQEQITDPKAFGLIGMSERAHFLGGEVEITGQENKGTKVTVRIPLMGRK